MKRIYEVDGHRFKLRWYRYDGLYPELVQNNGHLYAHCYDVFMVRQRAQVNKIAKEYLEEYRNKWLSKSENLLVDYPKYAEMAKYRDPMGTFPLEYLTNPGKRLFLAYKEITGYRPKLKGVSRIGVYFKDYRKKRLTPGLAASVVDWAFSHGIEAEIVPMKTTYRGDQRYGIETSSVKWIKINFSLNLDSIGPTIAALAESLRKGEDCEFALRDALLEAGKPNIAELFEPCEIGKKVKNES